MFSKGLFSRVKKLIKEEDPHIKASEAGPKNALLDGKSSGNPYSNLDLHKIYISKEVKQNNFEDDLEKLQLEQLKQEIFDRIHALIEERGYRTRWEAEAEEILQADFPKIFTGPAGMEFVKVPAGEFMMGSPESEKDRYNSESPLHKVTIRTSFLLGKFPVTQKQWKSVMGSNPSHFKSDDLPVEQVSWDDVQKFIKKLNEMEETDKYRLPSEAEWEHACRAGTTNRYSFGDDESRLKDYAWYSGYSTYEEWKKNMDKIASEGKTHSVGQKNPNAWGLYDMHGNVWEWCQDKWHDNYNGAPSDGSAWEDGGSSYRVARGGGWSSFAGGCRSAVRRGGVPGDRDFSIGFRVLRTL